MDDPPRRITISTISTRGVTRLTFECAYAGRLPRSTSIGSHRQSFVFHAFPFCHRCLWKDTPLAKELAGSLISHGLELKNRVQFNSNPVESSRYPSLVNLSRTDRRLALKVLPSQRRII